MLACDRARFAGDPVAAVAAETLQRGGRGARADRGRLRGARLRCSTRSGRATRAPRSSMTVTTSPTTTPRTSGSGRSRGRTSATASVSARATWKPASPRPTWSSRRRSGRPARSTRTMEPHASVAHWEDGRLHVWTGTQTPFNLRSDLAGIFGIDEDRIRIVVPSHGRCLRREDVRPPRGDRRVRWLARPAVPSVPSSTAERGVADAQSPSGGDPGPAGRARRRDAPREGSRMLGGHRRVRRLRAGRRAEDGLCGPGARTGSRTSRSSRAASTRTSRRTALFGATGRCRRCGRPSGRWTCSPSGWTPIRSSCVSRTCSRKAIATRPARSSTTSGSRSASRRRPPRSAGTRAGKRKGLCVLMKGMQTPSRAGIAIEASDDGTFTLRCATAEMGQGARRAVSLLAAELLGVDVDRIRFPDPDTDLVPYDTRTTSSRSTYIMGRALVDAVSDLQENGQRGYGEVEIPGRARSRHRPGGRLATTGIRAPAPPRYGSTRRPARSRSCACTPPSMRAGS